MMSILDTQHDVGNLVPTHYSTNENEMHIQSLNILNIMFSGILDSSSISFMLVCYLPPDIYHMIIQTSFCTNKHESTNYLKRH